MKRTPIIAIDFDGVVADTAVSKKNWILRNVGFRYSGVSSSRTEMLKFIGSSNYAAMQENVGFSDTLSALPVEGCEYWLPRLSSVVSVVIISARSKDKMLWVDRWLDVWDLRRTISDVITAHGASKLRIVRRIGAECMVDDDIRHLRGAGSELRVLFNSSKLVIGRGVKLARSWRDIHRLSIEHVGGKKGQVSF